MLVNDKKHKIMNKNPKLNPESRLVLNLVCKNWMFVAFTQWL